MSKLMVFAVLSCLSIVGLTMSTSASTGTKAGGGCCAVCDDCSTDCRCCTTGGCTCDDCTCACCLAGAVAKRAGCPHWDAAKTSPTDALLAATGATVAGQSVLAKATTCCRTADCGYDDGCLCCQDGPCVCEACDGACCAAK